VKEHFNEDYDEEKKKYEIALEQKRR